MKDLKLKLEFENGGLGFYKDPTTNPLESFTSYLVFDEFKRIKFICVIYNNDETQRYELFELIPANSEGRGIKTWDLERTERFVNHLNEA